MKFKKYITEAKAVHWKKSRFSTYAACDKRGAENLKLENCKHTDDYSKVTCKKCQKEVMMVKRVNKSVFEQEYLTESNMSIKTKRSKI